MPAQPPIHRTHRKRYDIPRHAHYLTFSCFRRQPFFFRPRAPRWFLDAVDAARSRHPFDLWGFVVMPEHVHLLLLPTHQTRISQILRSIKRPVTTKAIAWATHHSPPFLSRMAHVQSSGRACHRFWQRGGGYDRNLWTPRAIHEKLHYIHANPVRRGLATQADGWVRSSYDAWRTSTDDPIRIDRDSLPGL